MTQDQGSQSWAAMLRTWWLSVATIVGSISLLTWAAWIASIDPAGRPSDDHLSPVRGPERSAAPIPESSPSLQPREPQGLASQAKEVSAEVQESSSRQLRAPQAHDSSQPQPRESQGLAPHVLESGSPQIPSPAAPQLPPHAQNLDPPAADPASAADASDANTGDKRRGDKGRSLAGWVFDESGVGVAGLNVVAEPRRMFGEDSPPAGLRAATDRSGGFAFAQVPDGEYQLRTEATRQYESASAIVRAGADSVVLHVKERSGKTIVVHGVVESTRGRTLDSVRVELTGRPAVSAFTNADGQYTLRIESAAALQNPSVRFTRKGYRDFSAPLGKDLASAPTDITQNARLEPVADASTLTGSVRGNDGSAVAGAAVELYSAEIGRTYRAASDRNGAFALTGIDSATDFRLWVRPTAKYKDRTLENVIIGGSIDVVVEAISSATFTGRFVNPDGQPVADFTMWLTPAYGATRAVAVRSDGQGAFAVTDVPEGPFMLGTRAAPALSVTGLQASTKSSGDVRVPLDVGSYRLEGTLASEDGQPVGGARISLTSTLGVGIVSTSSRETVTDSNGYFLFTQLGGGPHTLAVTAAGFRALQRAAPVGPVNAPIALTLQRGH